MAAGASDTIMQILQIISQHKRARGRFGAFGQYIPANPIPRGMRRVEAIVVEDGQKQTRHINIPLK